MNPFLNLLKLDGTMVLIGALSPLEPIVGGTLMAARRSIASTAIGGMTEMQEMMDFCAEHNVVSDVEVVRIQDIDTAFNGLQKGEV